MLNEIKDYIEKTDNYHIEESIFHKKVTPKFLTHDEICYHIDTLISLNIYSDKESREFIFYRENHTEIIGEELEVDLEDFIDFETPAPEYTEALSKMKIVVGILKKNS